MRHENQQQKTGTPWEPPAPEQQPKPAKEPAAALPEPTAPTGGPAPAYHHFTKH